MHEGRQGVSGSTALRLSLRAWCCIASWVFVECACTLPCLLECAKPVSLALSHPVHSGVMWVVMVANIQQGRRSPG